MPELWKRQQIEPSELVTATTEGGAPEPRGKETIGEQIRSRPKEDDREELVVSENT
ncbi:hypothetical protein A2U01_0089631 [Trifolium medium]|uniref:Uncharacterized protein n=1 Tax=Trifolium medium TaxID=97028 RepID=A0A392U7G5_9FABA|nr:hypothetical protein [Trifolium medium]